MSRREFIIPFIGLKLGEHVYNYEIGPGFFDGIEYSLIKSGSVNVRLALHKKETMMIGEFECEGVVSTECDRCNGPVDVAIKGAFRLVFKLSTDVTDDESLIVLSPEAYELDVKPHIYELMTISLPARTVHPSGECDEEMMAALSQYLVNPSSVEDDQEDWDDEDWDDEDWDDEDEENSFSDEDEEEWDDDEDDDPNRPIDPRWSALKNLN